MSKSMEKSHIEIKQDEIETAKKERRLRELFFTKERIKKMETKELKETQEKIWGKDEQEKTESSSAPSCASAEAMAGKSAEASPFAEATEDKMEDKGGKKPEEDLNAAREELTKELAKGEKVEEKKDETKEKTDINDLRESIKKVAESVRAEGVPVDDSCRIDMRAFEGLECEMQDIYSREKIIKDQKFVDKRLDKYGRLKPEDKLKTSGEQLEILKTCIFHKFLKDDFVVVRSSKYDDIKNGVDNIILERKTGKILCAIDEVADNCGEIFEYKQEKIAKKNLEKGGTFVKYGLGMKDEKIVLCPRMNVPVFYLASSKNEVEKGVNDFNISEEKSDTEKTYYKNWISSMLLQISLMSSESRKSDINKNLMENVNYFYNVLEKIKTESDN